MSIGSLLSSKAAVSAGIGICCGFAEFAWRTIAQKVAMVVGKLEFTPALGPYNGPRTLPFEVLDKEFVSSVVGAPAAEEIAFRGFLQPMLSAGLVYCFPQLAAPALLGISQASLLSITAVGSIFGSLHSFNYEKGGDFPATMRSIAGSIYGIAAEKFGLIASVAAHMTSNLCTGLLNKYWPELLEFSWERELRLLPQQERELKFLREAIQRAEAEHQRIHGNEQEKELLNKLEKKLLKELIDEWRQQLREIKNSQRVRS